MKLLSFLKKRKGINISFILFAYLLSVDVFAQNTMPRPAVEGYKNRDGDYDIISKNPMAVATRTCAWFGREGNGTYLYAPPEPAGNNPPDWPHPFPKHYTFQCAVPSNDPSGEPSFWTPCCSMNWGSSSQHSPSENAPQHCPKTEGNPIDIGLGEKIQTEEDLHGVERSPLKFSRYYNSGSSNNRAEGGFGLSWTHTYDRRIVAGSISQKSDPGIQSWRLSGQQDGWVQETAYMMDGSQNVSSYDYVYVVRSNGKSLYHHYNGTAWQTDYGVASTLSVLPSQDGWLFITKDNVRETYDFAGRLITIENTLGQVQTLHYELAVNNGGDGNPQTLDRVEDDEGNYLTFSYNQDTRIQQVTASTGDTYQYTYHTFGRLERVTFSDATSRYYHYDNSSTARLSGITDENNVRYASWEYDTRGRATASEHANGVDRVTVSYSIPRAFWSVNGNTGSVTVTNPLNKQTTYHFTSWQGTAQLTQVEGHPSANCAGANKAYTYDANGFLASKTDWKNNLTTYVHNNSGQELSRTEASGTPQARTITTEWHATFNLPVRIIEPERETVMSYDANGRLLSREVRERGGL